MDNVKVVRLKRPVPWYRPVVPGSTALVPTGTCAPVGSLDLVDGSEEMVEGGELVSVLHPTSTGLVTELGNVVLSRDVLG